MNENVNIEFESEMPEEAVLNKDSGERMFTQSQLEEIISERLKRERKVNESLKSVKHVLSSACDSGLIKKGSYAEMAQELVCRLRGQAPSEPPCETSDEENGGLTQPVADTPDTSWVCGQDGKDAECGGNIKDTPEKAADGDGFLSVLSYLKENFPAASIEELLSGDLFERFARGRSGSAREIVDDFFGFASALSKRENEAVSEGYSSHASTAFSSGGSSEVELTSRQMEIAKSAGMSYREYAQMLESIPKSKGRII